MTAGEPSWSGRRTRRISRRWLGAAALASAGGVLAVACGDPPAVERTTTITVVREVAKFVTREVPVEQVIVVRITVTPTPTPPPRRTELTVNLATDHTQGARGRATRWGLEALQGLEPFLRVNLVPRPGEELAQLLAAAMAPEVLLGSPFTFTNFLPSGAWMEISPSIAKLAWRMRAVPDDTYFVPDTYTDNRWEHSVPMLRHMEGPQFGWAFALTLSGWLYNATSFARAGVPAPSDAWTWDTALEQAKRLTAPERGVWGIWARDDAAFGYLPLCYANGLDRYVDPGLAHTTLDAPAASEALAWHLRLIHHHKVSPPPGAQALAADPTLNPFAAGAAAMWPAGLAALGDLGQRVGPRFAWGVMPTPVSPRTRARAHVWTDEPLLVTRAATVLGATEEAAKVALFFGGQIFQDRVGEERGHIPNNRASLAKTPSVAAPLEGMTVVAQSAARCDNRSLFPFDVAPQWFAAVTAAAGAAYAGAVPPDEAGPAMARAGDAVLSRRDPAAPKPLLRLHPCPAAG